MGFVQRLLFVAREYPLKPGEIVRNVTWRLPRTVSDIDVVFIVGAPRSGTTLLQRVVAVHPDFFSIQRESDIFGFRNLFGRAHLELPKKECNRIALESRDIIDYFSKCVTYKRAQHEGRRFVEKTPQHVMKIGKLLKHFTNARIVNMYRDPRDCFASAQRNKGVHQGKSADQYARYWRRCIEAWMEYREHDNVLGVKYEAFVNDTDAELDRVMTFLGAEAHGTQTDPRKLSSDKRSEKEGFARLNSPIDASSCGRWSEQITREEASVIEAVCGEYMLRLGYPLS